MKLNKSAVLTMLPLAAVLALSGCAGASAPAEEPTTADETTTSEAATPFESPESDVIEEGEATSPGSRAGAGEPLVYEFTNMDDGKALISAKLIDVVPASAEPGV